MFDVEASDSEGVRRIVLVGEFDLRGDAHR